MKVLNTAFYCFREIPEPEVLRTRALDLATRSGLKGTLLIAPEGINGNLAGDPAAIADFEDLLRRELAPEVLEFKHSYSESVPFRKLHVRAKKQILTFRTGDCDPAHEPGQRIDPKELAEWIDERKDFVFVDCRNRFEAHYGTFENSLLLEMNSFDDFPEAYRKLEKDIAGREVVMFCTGGIRCEKASSFLRAQGNTKVRQLHGGVLKYFEETGGKGWQGNCFVFDERIALAKDLSVVPGLTRDEES